MAKKQALKELQTRIADLLQRASSQPALAVSWLGVTIRGMRVLLPLQQSGEIYGMGTLHKVPYAQPWFLGVASLRGKVFGVIDLVTFIGADKVQGTATEASRQRLVALNGAFGLNAVIRVDNLEGLRGMEDFSRSEPAPEGSPEYYGSIYTDKRNYCWQEINLQTLAQFPAFLNIATTADKAP